MPTLAAMDTFRRLRAHLEASPFVVDAVGTALLALLVVPWSVSITGDETGASPFWAAALLAPLSWRRTRPVASAGAVFAVALLQVLTGSWLIFPADLLVLVALYSVTRHGPRWATRAFAVATVVGAVLLGGIVGFVGDPGEGLMVVFVVIAPGAAALTLALWRRSRAEVVDALRDRADRLERERDQQAQLAAAAERARIAREMHDVVAHSLSVVIAQADGGRYAAERSPEDARRALDTISETGRAALADVRRILGVLRDEVGAAERAGPQLTPQPSVTDLDALIERVRTSGVHVSQVRVGDPRQLPAGVGMTVHRICQEALTNVLKHAGPDVSVTVLQRWTSTALVLEVTDDGRGAAAVRDATSQDPGHGLIGMRERVDAFGGELLAGPRPEGGFRVYARLPLHDADGVGAQATDRAPDRATDDARTRS